MVSYARTASSASTILVIAIPVLIGITIVVYVILQLAPGGPQARFAQNPRMTAEQKAKFMAAWGLDQPIPIQYCRWMGFCDPTGDGLDLSQDRVGAQVACDPVGTGMGTVYKATVPESQCVKGMKPCGACAGGVPGVGDGLAVSAVVVCEGRPIASVFLDRARNHSQ